MSIRMQGLIKPQGVVRGKTIKEFVFNSVNTFDVNGVDRDVYVQEWNGTPYALVGRRYNEGGNVNTYDPVNTVTPQTPHSKYIVDDVWVKFTSGNFRLLVTESPSYLENNPGHSSIRHTVQFYPGFPFSGRFATSAGSGTIFRVDDNVGTDRAHLGMSSTNATLSSIDNDSMKLGYLIWENMSRGNRNYIHMWIYVSVSKDMLS